MKYSLFILLIVSLFGAAGCSAWEPKSPEGFVELDEEDSPYELRSTTADGVVYAVREIEHEGRGSSLAFWTSAIENEMRQRGGYALLATKKVKTARGQEGNQLRFGHDEGSVPHEYIVAVYVTGGEPDSLSSKIHVIEVGGPAKLLAEKSAAIEAVLANPW